MEGGVGFRKWKDPDTLAYLFNLLTLKQSLGFEQANVLRGFD